MGLLDKMKNKEKQVTGLLDRMKNKDITDYSAGPEAITPTTFKSTEPTTFTPRRTVIEQSAEVKPITETRTVLGSEIQVPSRELSKAATETAKFKRRKDTEERKAATKLAGETRSQITALLRETKDSSTPEQDQELNRLRQQLKTSVSTEFEKQPAFKTGLASSLLFDAGTAIAEKSGGISPEVIKRVEEKPGFKAGEVAGDVSKQLAAYYLAGPMISNTALGATLTKVLGGTKLAKFGATQITDFVVDRIVQTPMEAYNAIQNDDSLDEFGKTVVQNSFLDVVFNLAIGGSGEVLKKMMGKDNLIDDLIKKKAKELPPNIQRELGLSEDITAQEYLRQQTKQFKTDEIAEDVEAYYKSFEQPQRSLELEEAVVRTPTPEAPKPEGLLDRMKKNQLDIAKPEVGVAKEIEPDFLKDIEAEKPFKSIGEEIKQPSIDVKLFDDIEKELFPKKVIEAPDPLMKKTDPKLERSINDIAGYMKEQRTTGESMVSMQKVIADIDVKIPKDLEEKLKPLREKAAKDQADGKFAKNMDELIIRSPQYKDVGNAERWNTDIYRLSEKVFGDDYPVFKDQFLDKWDAAKKAKIEDEILLSDNLKKDIVDGLGIKRRSPESALVMRYGEEKIGLAELKQLAPEKWKDIVEADKWMRQQYDKLIDEINIRRMEVGKEGIPKRKNYYRHFNEMGDTFQGIKNVFESNRQITPGLEGISEFTRPGEKWMGMKQRFTGKGKYKEDAVGGMIDYIQSGTYAKHIDPEIPKFRKLTQNLKESTFGSKNMNKYVGFLEEFTNDLAGKTNKFDRAVQDAIIGLGKQKEGRVTMAVVNSLNSRMKSNAVLGNVSSSLSQIANVPQGIATVKDPKLLAEGLDGYFKSLVGGGDAALYKESGFLKERLTDVYGKFDTRMIDKPKKFAQWMLGALDETGTKFIWSSVYRKGLKEGVPDAIKYADDITRKLVAGRGIGEVPLMQKSKLYQLVAPFTLEVNNLWKVQKDFVKKKDFAALAILYAANYGLNEVMEYVRGSRVVFDPIEAVKSAVEDSEGLGDAAMKIPSSLAGEVLSNIPLGSTVAQLTPEYAASTQIEIPEALQKVLPKDLVSEKGTLRIPSREELFGENDPTRFGTKLPLARTLESPTSFLSSFALPFGGQQAKKTMQGLKTVKEGKALSRSKRLQTPVDPTLSTTIKAGLFGKSGIPEVQEYYEADSPPLGDKQTAAFEELMDTGNFDANELFTTLKKVKDFASEQPTKNAKKYEVINILKDTYSGQDLRDILRLFFNYKM